MTEEWSWAGITINGISIIESPLTQVGATCVHNSCTRSFYYRSKISCARQKITMSDSFIVPPAVRGTILQEYACPIDMLKWLQYTGVETSAGERRKSCDFRIIMVCYKEEVELELKTNGPFVATFLMGPSFHKCAPDSIYQGPNPSEKRSKISNHAVTIIGSGMAADSQYYLIYENSWGNQKRNGRLSPSAIGSAYAVDIDHTHSLTLPPSTQ